MRILNYQIDLHLHAKRPWTHFKIHEHEMHKHLVWGKVSLSYGQEHLTPIRVCADCYEEIQGKSAGDESWDWCEGCQQVEGKTVEITLKEFEAHNA